MNYFAMSLKWYPLIPFILSILLPSAATVPILLQAGPANRSRKLKPKVSTNFIENQAHVPIRYSAEFVGWLKFWMAFITSQSTARLLISWSLVNHQTRKGYQLSYFRQSFRVKMNGPKSYFPMIMIQMKYWRLSLKWTLCTSSSAGRSSDCLCLLQIILKSGSRSSTPSLPDSWWNNGTRSISR